MLPEERKGSVYVRDLLKAVSSVDQAVFCGKHKKALPSEAFAKGAVDRPAARKQASAMDHDGHRQRAGPFRRAIEVPGKGGAVRAGIGQVKNRLQICRRFCASRCPAQSQWGAGLGGGTEFL